MVWDWVMGHGSWVMRVTGQLNDGSRHVGHGSQKVTHCQLWHDAAHHTLCARRSIFSTDFKKHTL